MTVEAGWFGCKHLWGEDLLVAEERFGRGLGVEDVVDELFELLGFGWSWRKVGRKYLTCFGRFAGAWKMHSMGAEGRLADDGAVTWRKSVMMTSGGSLGA